jgi:hypothetical protein
LADGNLGRSLGMLEPFAGKSKKVGTRKDYRYYKQIPSQLSPFQKESAPFWLEVCISNN